MVLASLAVIADSQGKAQGLEFEHNMMHKGIEEEQVDSATKVLEEVVMTAIKLG